MRQTKIIFAIILIPFALLFSCTKDNPTNNPTVNTTAVGSLKDPQQVIV